MLTKVLNGSFGIAKNIALRARFFEEKYSILVFGISDLQAICIVAQSKSLVGLRLDMARNGIY